MSDQPPFPPTGPTTLQKVIISFLYLEYSDDPNLQGFVDAYNQLTQNYVDTFNAYPLALYTSPLIVGNLLDWVGEGIYGFPRPAFGAASKGAKGPFDTWALNSWAFNKYRSAVGAIVTGTTDDVYKRILTWHLYKGDGKAFNARWLKRRIARFLIGANGTNPPILDTYDISVTFLAPWTILITLTDQPMAYVFAEAVAAGALEIPFQLVVETHIGPVTGESIRITMPIPGRRGLGGFNSLGLNSKPFNYLAPGEPAMPSAIRITQADTVRVTE